MRHIQHEHETLPLALFRLSNCSWTAVDQLCGLWCLKKKKYKLYLEKSFEAVCITRCCNDTVWPLCPIDFKALLLFLGACLRMTLPSIQPRCRHTTRPVYIKENKKRELQPRSCVPAHTSARLVHFSLYLTCCYTLIAEMFHLSFSVLWEFCSPGYEKLVSRLCTWNIM